MAKMSKTSSGKSASFAKGGSTRMAGPSGAAPVVAGQVSLGGRSAGNKFEAGGGSGKMAGQSCAAPVVSGQVSVGGRTCDNSFSVKGGSGKMAGYTGAQNAKPC